MKQIHSMAIAFSWLAATSAFAQSKVDLYGIVSTDLVSINNVGTTSGRLNALNNGSLASSRIGFRGNEDLGGGLSAFFTLEAGFNADAGTFNASRYFNRGSFVGLKGNWGAVSLGRQWNLNDLVLGKFFKFGSYSAFRFTDFSYIQELHDNSVKYISPKLAGWQAAAMFAFSEGGNGTLATRQVREVAATYDSGPFSAGLTYHERDSLTNGATDTLTSGGVAYKFKALTGRLGASQADPKVSGTGKSLAYEIGVDYEMNAASTVSLDYVARDVKNSPNDSSFVRLLGVYQLSKRTSVYGNLVFLKNKGNAAQTVAGVGSIAPGKDQNLIGVGIRHNF